jgi:hypothetical protein
MIENDQIAALVTSFEAALRFERILPDGIPEEARKRLGTRLSDDARKFLGDLIGWFGQIHQAGQDALPGRNQGAEALLAVGRRG